jgi:hypothetical protein
MKRNLIGSVFAVVMMLAQPCAACPGWLGADDGLSCATPPKCTEGKPEIGMTEREAWAAWCMPSDIRTTKTADGTTSVWFYTGGRAYPADDRSAIFFTDGIVTAIQTR